MPRPHKVAVHTFAAHPHPETLRVSGCDAHPNANVIWQCRKLGVYFCSFIFLAPCFVSLHRIARFDTTTAGRRFRSVTQRTAHRKRPFVHHDSVCSTALGFVQRGLCGGVLSLLSLGQQHGAGIVVRLHRATSIP